MRAAFRLLQQIAKDEKMPSIQVTNQPQSIPFFIIVVKFLTSISKLIIPFMLEQTYAKFGSSLIQTHYYILMVLSLMAIYVSYLLEIFSGLVMSVYKQNVRKHLIMRIYDVNFMKYEKSYEEDYKIMASLMQKDNKEDGCNKQTNQKCGEIPSDQSLQNKQEQNMQLWSKIAIKTSIFINNYYDSYLSLLFEIFNIILILAYLFYQIKWALLVGMSIAGVIMLKVLSITRQMQDVQFKNVGLRAAKIQALQQYFNHLTEYKMSWLDQFVYSKISSIQTSYQENIKQLKLLDCWCVALWQFTTVGLSSSVILAYYLFGLDQNHDLAQHHIIKPATLIYLFTMLNTPLNGLSWYIAGLRTAKQALKQLKEDIRLSKFKENHLDQKSQGKFQSEINMTQKTMLFPQNLIFKFTSNDIHQNKGVDENKKGNQDEKKERQIDEQIKMKDDEKEVVQFQKDERIKTTMHNYCKIHLKVRELQQHKIYSLSSSELSQKLIKVICKLFPKTVIIGYIQQNAWMMDSTINTILFNLSNHSIQSHIESNSNIPSLHLTNKQFLKMSFLLQLFECSSIPLENCPVQFSGGEKLRISLVRAFYLSNMVVVNSTLNSLDVKMRNIVRKNIKDIVCGKYYQILEMQYTVFIRENQDIADFVVSLQKDQKGKGNSYSMHIKPNQQKELSKGHSVEPFLSEKVVLSTQIQIYIKELKRKCYKCSQDTTKKDKLLKQSLIQNCSDVQRSQQQVVTLKEMKLSIESEKRNQKSGKNSQSSGNNQNRSKGDKNRKVTVETYKHYYKSWYHVVFLMGISTMNIFSNYYNYYIHTQIQLGQITSQDIYHILVIIGVFVIGLALRSYYFAVANLQEATRICQTVHTNLIMNQLHFYSTNRQLHEENDNQEPNQNKNSNEQQNNENEQRNESKLSNSHQKSNLMTILSSDLQTITDHYAFITNIFFNNIFTIVSSITVILLELPLAVLLLVLIMMYTYKLNLKFHFKNEQLTNEIKQKQIVLYNAVSLIQNGKMFIAHYRKVSYFRRYLEDNLHSYLEKQYQSNRFRNYVNFQYKNFMMLFLTIAVIIYSFLYYEPIYVNAFEGQQFLANLSKINQSLIYGQDQIDGQTKFEASTIKKNYQAGLALLINYTLLLSSYILNFVLSLWEIQEQSLSIERSREFSEEDQAVSFRKDMTKLILEKIVNQKSVKREKQIHASKEDNEKLDIINQNHILIDLKDFSFRYHNNGGKIFQNLNLQVRQHDVILLKGKSGSGKTTLYKLLTSCYPNAMQLQPLNLTKRQSKSSLQQKTSQKGQSKSSFYFQLDGHISYSPQHPLLLPLSKTLLENIDPYCLYGGIEQYPEQIRQFISKYKEGKLYKQILKEQIQSKPKEHSLTTQNPQGIYDSSSLSHLSYEEKIILNNLRAYLYGRGGVVIYDEPEIVLQPSDGKSQTCLIVTHHQQFNYNKRYELEDGNLHQI